MGVWHFKGTFFVKLKGALLETKGHFFVCCKISLQSPPTPVPTSLSASKWSLDWTLDQIVKKLGIKKLQYLFEIYLLWLLRKMKCPCVLFCARRFLRIRSHLMIWSQLMIWSNVLDPFSGILQLRNLWKIEGTYWVSQKKRTPFERLMIDFNILSNSRHVQLILDFSLAEIGHFVPILQGIFSRKSLQKNLKTV